MIRLSASEPPSPVGRAMVEVDEQDEIDAQRDDAWGEGGARAQGTTIVLETLSKTGVHLVLLLTYAAFALACCVILLTTLKGAQELELSGARCENATASERTYGCTLNATGAAVWLARAHNLDGLAGTVGGKQRGRTRPTSALCGFREVSGVTLGLLVETCLHAWTVKQSYGYLCL